MKWQQLFDRTPYRLIKRHGFSIQLFAHSGFFRYVEDNRAITLMFKMMNETPVKRGPLSTFKARPRVVYIPSELTWDDGTVFGQDESPAVLTRICETLRGRLGRCTAVIDDAMYEEMQQDVDRSRSIFRKKERDI